MGQIIQFDFSKLLNEAYAYYEDEGVPSKVAALPLFMPIEAVRSYMARFLEANFVLGMNDILIDDSRQPPSANYRNPLYGSFRDAVPPIGKDGRPLRHFTEYPLTEEQTMAAMERYHQIPLLAKIIATIQAGLLEYFGDMLAFHEDQQTGRRDHEHWDNLRTRIGEYKEFGAIFSFIHDMTPLFAHSLVERGIPVEDGLSAQAFHLGLGTSFRKSAFRSYELTPQAPRIRECPFSKVIGPLFATSMSYDNNGRIVAAPESGVPGEFPAFVARRLEIVTAPTDHMGVHL